TTGTLAACCASGASGAARMLPPTTVMNVRRSITLGSLNIRARSAAWALDDLSGRSRSSPQRGTIEVAGVNFRFVAIRIKDEQRPAFEWLLALDRPPRPILRRGKRLDDFIERVLSDRKGKVHRPAALMPPSGLLDL